MAESIRRRVADGNGKIAMDYGCGTGLVGLKLLDVFEKILFVDASENMVRQVHRKISAFGANILHFDIMIDEKPQVNVE